MQWSLHTEDEVKAIESVLSYLRDKEREFTTGMPKLPAWAKAADAM